MSQLSGSIVEGYSQVGVSTLTTLLFKRGLRKQLMRDLVPVCPRAPRLVGQACTLRYIPAREDLDTPAAYSRDDHPQRQAIETCPPGHVLVIDARGDTSAACAGDLMIGRLKARGAAGIVTDGGFRDVVGIEKVNLPTFHRRPAPAPAFIAHHAADINLPIGCGGVAVYPGDLIVGDADGVIVVPRHLAEEVLKEAIEATRYDEFAEAEIARGRSLVGLYPPTPASMKEYEAWNVSRAKV